MAWFTVETAELTAVAAVLDVKITRRRGERKGFPLAARQLADGRWLVVSSNCDEPLFKAKVLSAMSRLGRTFSGMFEEHVMASGFAAWSKGRKAWSIHHQGDDNPLHLRTAGRLPQDIAVLKDAALARQRQQGEDGDTDYLFDLALDLVRPQAGLDPEVDFDDGEFQQLHIGFWRDLWRRTLWWRLLLIFLAGGVLFIYCLEWLSRLLGWLLRALGFR